MHFAILTPVLFCLIYNVPTSGAYGHFGLVNFLTMTYCRLGINGLSYYDGYGCYCGAGGSGEPVDEIDRRCMEHDKCYSQAITKGGCWFSIQKYLATYHYRCIDRRAHCVKGLNNRCEQWICECDRKAVNSWAELPLPTTKRACQEKANSMSVGSLWW